MIQPSTPQAEQTWYLRVIDLKQFDYCPRVVYYEYCLPGVRPTTFKMAAGITAQDRVNELETRRSLRAYGVTEGERHFHLSLQSLRLGCTGQVDLVVETGEGLPQEAIPTGGARRLIPVDFKLSRREPGRHFKLQLALYALMLEETWRAPVTEGFIYLIPAKRTVRVPITTRLRGDAERTLTKIRTMIAAEQMPPPTKQRGKCINCEFRRFCNDVV